jgi:NAD-dependent SIR2 family protein deacetylase
MAQQKNKAGRPSFLQPSEFHTCNKCKTTKPASEFYKCSSRPTGKQPNCKECNREEGVYFRHVLREEYYWSQNGTG